MAEPKNAKYWNDKLRALKADAEEYGYDFTISEHYSEARFVADESSESPYWSRWWADGDAEDLDGVGAEII